MDYQKLLDLYPFRAEYNGYMDYYLDISKEQLTDVYEQTKSYYYGSKKERLKESEKQQEYLNSILARTDYNLIRIHIFEFNLYQFLKMIFILLCGKNLIKSKFLLLENLEYVSGKNEWRLFRNFNWLRGRVIWTRLTLSRSIQIFNKMFLYVTKYPFSLIIGSVFVYF